LAADSGLAAAALTVAAGKNAKCNQNNYYNLAWKNAC
jgi:hypothetical protein